LNDESLKFGGCTSGSDFLSWRLFSMMFELLGALMQQISQAEILLGDQIQNMLAWCFRVIWRWRRTRRIATIK
jgi:hypothetical protein